MVGTQCHVILTVYSVVLRSNVTVMMHFVVFVLCLWEFAEYIMVYSMVIARILLRKVCSCCALTILYITYSTVGRAIASI